MIFVCAEEERKGPSFTIDLDATLEDLYNGRTLTVTHKKQILCPVCRGTGAQNPDDVRICFCMPHKREMNTPATSFLAQFILAESRYG